MLALGFDKVYRYNYKGKTQEYVKGIAYQVLRLTITQYLTKVKLLLLFNISETNEAKGCYF